MNQGIQKKIEQYKKLAKDSAVKPSSFQPVVANADGLTKVIRSKKDADNFMAELNSIVERAK